MRKNRENKIGNFFANKNARFVITALKVVLHKKYKNKTRANAWLWGFASNEGMGGQRRSNTKEKPVPRNGVYDMVTLVIEVDSMVLSSSYIRYSTKVVFTKFWS